jgi:hypothetical protein
MKLLHNTLVKEKVFKYLTKKEQTESFKNPKKLFVLSEKKIMLSTWERKKINKKILEVKKEKK